MRRALCGPMDEFGCAAALAAMGTALIGPCTRRRLASSMQRIACPERDDWRATAEACGFRFSYHRRRTLLGRARLLRIHARRNRAADRGADRRDRCDVPRTGRPRGRGRTLSAPAEDTGSVLAADLAKAGIATRPASMAGSISVLTAMARQSCWNIMPIHRPRFSRRRFFNGPGSNRRSSGASFPPAPTSSTRSTNA